LFNQRGVVEDAPEMGRGVWVGGAGKQDTAAGQHLINRQGDFLVHRLDRLRRGTFQLGAEQVEGVKCGGDLLAEEFGELEVVGAETVRPWALDVPSADYLVVELQGRGHRGAVPLRALAG